MRDLQRPRCGSQGRGTQVRQLLVLCPSSQPLVADQVRSAVARLFVQASDASEMRQVGIAKLVHHSFLITASHLLPATEGTRVWVQLVSQTDPREVIVHTRLSTEDVAFLHLQEPVNVKGVGVPMARHPRSLAAVSVDQVVPFERSAYEDPSGVSIGYYPRVGISPGTAIVDATSGQMVGVHTSIMWVNNDDKKGKKATKPADSEFAKGNVIGEFQVLTHEPVLRALRAAAIISASETSALARPEEDGHLRLGGGWTRLRSRDHTCTCIVQALALADLDVASCGHQLQS